jgi:hypothetical protein
MQISTVHSEDCKRLSEIKYHHCHQEKQSVPPILSPSHANNRYVTGNRITLWGVEV